MKTCLLDTLDTLIAARGNVIAVSDSVPITQDHVGQFAAVTGDTQWIHLDEQRCRSESPFGGTIAHGYLTISLTQQMMNQCISYPDGSTEINYGLDKLRFVAPVRVGESVRGEFAVKDAVRVGDNVKIQWIARLYTQSKDELVCYSEPIFLRSRIA